MLRAVLSFCVFMSVLGCFGVCWLCCLDRLLFCFVSVCIIRILDCWSTTDSLLLSRLLAFLSVQVLNKFPFLLYFVSLLLF